MKFYDFYVKHFRPEYLEGVVRNPEQIDYVIRINCEPLLDMELVDITLNDCNQVIKTADENYAIDRAKRVRNVLRRVMKYAFACRLVDFDITNFEFRKIKPRTTAVKQMYTAEQAAFLTSGDSLKARLFRFECLTGLRREEVLALRWRNVDFENRRIYVCETIVIINGRSQLVADTKNHRFRFVDLNDSAFELLSTQSRKSDFCFFNPSTLGYLSPRQYHVWFNDLWFEKSRSYKALTGEPLPPLTPHKLRHTFASLLVSGGADVKTVADLLGHSNVDITNRYLHSYDLDRKKAVTLIKM